MCIQEPTDDELMISLQEGKSQAFDALVDRYQGILVGFFMRNTRDVQFSEDLAQETLIKIYEQFWNYLPTGRFRGWMFRIARNLLIDNIRRRSHDALVQAVRRRPNEEVNAMARLAGQVMSPEDRVHCEQFAGHIDALLAEIPEDQRQTFTLHHYSELSLPEVAEIMEVPVATCKSRLRLAREKLREKLRARGIGPARPG